MDEQAVFHIVAYGWLALAAPVFALLFFVAAPYGRHQRGGWGPTIGRTAGWVVMESPALLGFILFFALGGRWSSLPALLFFCMWTLHYGNRVLVFPFRMRGGTKRITLAIVGFGLLFNLMNSYLQGRYIGTLGPVYPPSWLTDPRLLAGVALFGLGMAINLHSDQVLFNLRRGSEAGYKIPRGGFYRWVSCPNYFGELLEWSGWAMATWSLPGLAFAAWTAANLVPRAWAHHRWYRQEFPEYPPGRRAVIPYLL